MLNLDELDDFLIKKLWDSGSLNKIESKIKRGMYIAIQELKENLNSESGLLYEPFFDIDKEELIAIDIILNYLKKNNLNSTLLTFLEESNINNNNNNNNINILNLIKNYSVFIKK